jgi:hypothetical protein
VSTLDSFTKIIYQEPQIEKIASKIECQILTAKESMNKVHNFN